MANKTWQAHLTEILRGISDIWIRGADTERPTLRFAELDSKGQPVRTAREKDVTVAGKTYPAGSLKTQYLEILAELRKAFPSETVGAKVVYERLTTVEGFKAVQQAKGFIHLSKGGKAAAKASTSKGFGGKLL